MELMALGNHSLILAAPEADIWAEVGWSASQEVSIWVVVDLSVLPGSAVGKVLPVSGNHSLILAWQVANIEVEVDLLA